MKRIMILSLCLATGLLSLSASARPKFDPSQLEFIDNGTIKLGVSKDLGGAITYKGAMSYLLLQPGLKPEEGDWVKVKRIRFGK